MAFNLIDKGQLEAFLKEKKFSLQEKIAKGWSSEIYLVKDNKGQKFALKMERKDSPREKMVEKEAANLKKANAIGLGPKLAGFDFKRRIILIKFVEGKTFNRWLFSQPSRQDLVKVLKELFAQAEKLDEVGLSHGQLAGKGANIIVSKNLKPVIIDFEKASGQRKCHNVTQLTSFLVLNKNSALAKLVREILKGG